MLAWGVLGMANQNDEEDNYDDEDDDQCEYDVYPSSQEET